MGSDLASEEPVRAERRDIDPDLVSASVLRSRRDAPWAVLADAALAVFAAELALRYRPAWGLGVLAGLTLVVGMQLARYRYRVVAAAGQLKLAAGLLLMAASAALFLDADGRPWASICVLGAAGAAKLARELARYLSFKRRMIEIGLRRRCNPKTVLVSGAVFLVTATLTWQGLATAGGGMRVALVAWLAGWSLVSVVMELWA
jgi:hypothetical protein